MRSPTLRFAPPGLRPPKIACATGAERMPSRGCAPGHPAKGLIAKEIQPLWSPTQPNAGTQALRARLFSGQVFMVAWGADLHALRDAAPPSD